MTNEEAVKRLTAKIECMERENSGTDLDCDECELCYAQGTLGEQIEALRMAIEALSRSEFPNSSDMISRQAAIDAILAVTGNSSVRELYEHVQEHGLSEMWSGGVNAAIDTIIAVPSAQPERKKTRMIVKSNGKTNYYVCEKCDEPLDPRDNYCPNCGDMIER